MSEDNLSVDRTLSQSPELVLPMSQMPHTSNANEYLESLQNDISSRPTSVAASNTEAGNRKVVELSDEDDDDDDEEYPDPNSFLNARRSISRSSSPELGSPRAKTSSFDLKASAIHKSVVSAGGIDGSAPGKVATSDIAAISVPAVAETCDQAAKDVEKEGPDAEELDREVERASSMAKLGKRRRRGTGSSDDEYDQEPVPRAIDKDHELVQVNRGYLNQLSARKSTPLPLASPRTRAHDNLATPLSMQTYRRKIKVVPFSSKSTTSGPYSPAKRIRMSHIENLDSSEINGESIPTPLFVHMPNSAPVQGTFPDVVVIHPGDHINDQSPDILAPQSSQLTDSTGTNPKTRQPFDLSDGNPVTHISQTPDDVSHENATIDHDAAPVVAQSVSVPSTNPSDLTQATQEIVQTSDSDGEDSDMFEDASEVQSQAGDDGLKHSELDLENRDNTGKLDLPSGENGSDSGNGSDSSLPSQPTPTQKDIDHLLGSFASIPEPAPKRSENDNAESENPNDDTLFGRDKDVEIEANGDKEDALSSHSSEFTSSDSGSDSSAGSKADSDTDSSTASEADKDADADVESGLNADMAVEGVAAEGSTDDTANEPDNNVSSQIAESVAAAVVVAAATRSKNGWTRHESESGEEIIEKKQPTVDVFDDEWKIGDHEVALDEVSGRLDMPKLLSSPRGSITRSLSAVVSEETISTERRAAKGRKRRVSSSRRLSTCQRLLQLQNQMGEDANGSPGLGIMLDSSVLGSNGTSGINGTASTSIPPSPSRRSTFSGAIRVFGEGEPEISDHDRLGYMRRLKGLIHNTNLTAREGLRVLYFCTGNWANARKQILNGPESLPEECVWNPEDDFILRCDSCPEKVEDLRNRRGNVEVYRRLQFLNTFHGSSTSV
ncbi:hypothetical protein IW150_004191 [Coemansia sp. RSA 2607]|nr:hypothetical protein IW150_004191 [Coemansia sp. RSA 2607]